MDKALIQTLQTLGGTDRVYRGEVLQPLWSGYGEIVRYHLQGGTPASVVVKQIALPDAVAHPRGWHSDLGHRRKLRSYAVEAAWYRDGAGCCPDACRVARCHAVVGEGMVSAMVLEDLDAAGFATRLARADEPALHACLRWLAHFHAAFVGAEAPAGLWPRGSYWHLETRPDELAAMPEGPLKSAAGAIDAKLASARYRTLVHGDAKIANFCFADDHRRVAAVDFQYVGGGVGVSDLAYFLGSCLGDDALAARGDALLDAYLEMLRDAVLQRGALAPEAVEAMLDEWRGLYPLAWADFERFLQGWSPGHPKLNDYSARLTARALRLL